MKIDNDWFAILGGFIFLGGFAVLKFNISMGVGSIVSGFMLYLYYKKHKRELSNAV